MKKSKFILGLLLGVVVGAGLAVGIYFLTKTDLEWETFLKEEIIPTALIVLTAIGTILSAAIPIVNRINNAVGKFNQATKDVNSTVENSTSVSESVKNYSEQIGKFTTTITEQVAPLAKDIESLKTMAKMIACNSSELVEKGAAEKIVKMMGENDEG